MCDDDYKQIDEEMLYGVPVEDQPEPDTKRNLFNEAQPITTKNTACPEREPNGKEHED